MRLVVTGSRHGHPRVWETLDRWLARNGVPELVILGDARGVDADAKKWAQARALNFVVVRARWATLGRAAGHLRNAAMIAMAKPGDHCVAFPRKGGKGTHNCMLQARAAGLRVFAVADDPKW